MTSSQATREKTKASVESHSRRGLVNGNGFSRAGGKVNGNYRARGLVNGLRRIGGTGLTNGLTNGLGRVNGLGLTNGLSQAHGHVNGIGQVDVVGKTNGLRHSGFVNGHGLVNGTRKPMRSNPFGIVTHKDLRIGISLVVLFVLLLPTFYLIVSPPQPRPRAISIDGQFVDWERFPSYHDNVGGPNPGIAFTEYSLFYEEETVFVMLRTVGQLFMDTQEYDAFYAFIDSDGSPATGYWPEEIGAEYAAIINGGDSRITSANLWRFEPGADSLNWSALRSVVAIPGAFSGNFLEFAISTYALNLSSAFAIRLAANDFDGNTVLASLRIGREHGAMRVEQFPRTDPTPLTPSSNEVLHLKFQTHGRRVEIPDFQGSAHWQSYPANLEGLLSLPNQLFIDADRTQEFDVGVNLAGLSDGRPLWLNLTRLDANVPVTIGGDGGVAYVNRLPQYKTIDGWFGDWQSDIRSDTGPPLANPNVDIKYYASNVTIIGPGGIASFYVDFVGKAMGGSMTPVELKWAAPSQPSPPSTPRPLKRIAGQDRLVISIDVNKSDPAGCSYLGLTFNFKLEMRGHAKKVDSKTLYACSGNVWTQVEGQTPLAMVSGSKLEASVDLSVIGVLDQPEYLIESTDWNGMGDMPPMTGLGTRSSRDSTRGADYPRVLSDPPGVNQTTSLPLSSEPNLDGNCDDSAYDGASKVVDINLTFFVGHYKNRLYVCIIANDSTNNGMDYAELLFDTKHDGVGIQPPQDDDRRFTVQANSNIIGRRRGNGAGWVACDLLCGPGDQASATFYNGYQTYEFSINVTNVWNGTRRAGFAVHTYDASTSSDCYWGSWVVNVNLPATWGHLDIPELPEFMMIVLVILALAGFRRKRRHA